jgi:hypothetical protein
VQVAVAAKHLLEMILSPDGGAADGEQSVAVLGGMQECGGEYPRVISDRAQRGRNASEVGEHGPQGGTDRVNTWWLAMGWPAGTTSVPVSTIVTRGGRRTRSVVRPRAAAATTCPAVTT